MQSIWAIGAAAVALLGAGAASAEPSVQIKWAAARVVVIPEDRSDVKVTFVTTNPGLPMTVRTDGDRVIVDGNLRHRVGNCHAQFGRVSVHVRDVGEVSYDNLPQILIRTPKDAVVEANGAVFGSVERPDSLDLSNSGCGDWTVGNVKGRLKIEQAGSGDTHAGTSGDLIVHVAGSGDVVTRENAGGASVDIAGSGDVILASINGPLHANIAGSGDVKVAAGHATEMVVNIAGSGDVRFGGVADSLKAAVAGSGDVDVAKVTGPVRKSIIGSGDVNIGG